MTKTPAHRGITSVLIAGAAGLWLSGCTASPPSSVDDQPVASASVSPLCAELAEQLEVLNFFPNVIAGEDTSGAQLMADDVEQLRGGVPADLDEPLGQLLDVMTGALKDPTSFDDGGFVSAKIGVEDWGLANC